jgi:hypothetical protein
MAAVLFFRMSRKRFVVLAAATLICMDGRAVCLTCHGALCGVLGGYQFCVTAQI